MAEGHVMGELAEEIIEQTPYVLRVQLPEVGGEYELTCSCSLVQAVGQCSGMDFYFRAKHSRWEFETEDQHGHPFPEKDSRRFTRLGTYDPQKPGAMSIEWAARILRRCLAEWWGSIPSP
jgi:hypothetical protein